MALQPAGTLGKSQVASVGLSDPPRLCPVKIKVAPGLDIAVLLRKVCSESCVVGSCMLSRLVTPSAAPAETLPKFCVAGFLLCAGLIPIGNGTMVLTLRSSSLMSYFDFMLVAATQTT